jgi:hypothetical protein
LSANLERFCAAERDEWDLLADKAKRWLLQCKAQPVNEQDWLEAALDTKRDPSASALLSLAFACDFRKLSSGPSSSQS